MMENISTLKLLSDRMDRLETRLEERLEERHEDLRERMEDLRQDIAALTGALLARLDAHDEYHLANEHRWGLLRLASRHPLRLAALAAAVVATASAMPELRVALLKMLSDFSGFAK